MRTIDHGPLDATAFTLYRQAAALASQALELRAAAEQLLRAVGDRQPAAAAAAAAAPPGFPRELQAGLQQNVAVATKNGSAPAEGVRPGQVAPAVRPARRVAARPAKRVLDVAECNRQLAMAALTR